MYKILDYITVFAIFIFGLALVIFWKRIGLAMCKSSQAFWRNLGVATKSVSGGEMFNKIFILTMGIIFVVFGFLGIINLLKK